MSERQPHLNSQQRRLLAELWEQVEPKEIFGCLGQLVAHNAQDANEGIAIRRKISKLAKEVANCKWQGPEPPKSKEQLEAEWKRRGEVMHAMDARVEKACKDAGHKKVYVDYSAYKSGEDDIPIDNLGQVAAPGKVVLIQEADEFYGGEKSKDYRSPVLESPTWLQVAVYANEMIRRTRDTHHCFLEGIGKVMEEGDVTIYEFSMGS